MKKGYKPHQNIKKIPAKRNYNGSKDKDKWWPVVITFISFFLSIVIMFISSNILNEVNLIIVFFVVFFIILLGVLCDIIGVAVTAAEETPFHALSAKKYYGAKQAVFLIRNASKVGSICNDVIGDICGVVSGAAGATIVIRLFSGNTQSVFIEAVMGAVIASMTVGGKALGKSFGIKNCNIIVYRVAAVMTAFIPKTREK